MDSVCWMQSLNSKKRGVFAEALIKKGDGGQNIFMVMPFVSTLIQNKLVMQICGQESLITSSFMSLPWKNLNMWCLSWVHMVQMRESLIQGLPKEYRLMKTSNYRKKFHYPEVIHNHFTFRHTVDDHNGKRHSPICLEYVWATKRWAHRPFSFLLAISEVNTNLAEA